MHQRFVSRVAGLALATLLTASVISCATMATGPVVMLPNGYYLRPDKQEQSEIAKRGGQIVLPQPVAAYAVNGNIVAGAQGDAPAWTGLYPDRPFVPGPNTRYFILDTASGKLETNLDAAQWHRRLQQLGVPSDFEIQTPLPWKQP